MIFYFIIFIFDSGKQGYVATTVIVVHFPSDFLFSLLHIIPIKNNMWLKKREERAKKAKSL